MQRFGSAGNRRGTGGGAVLAVMLCLLPGPAPAQSGGQSAGHLSPPLRLSAADLPELTLASSDGLLIGAAARPPKVPPPPPARTAARVPAPPLAPADPEVAALVPVEPVRVVLAPVKSVVLVPAESAELPDSTSLSLAVLTRVLPAAAPRAEPPQPMPAALRTVAPQARAAERLATAAPTRRLTRVAPVPLPPRWLDPQNPADRGVLEGIFGTPLPPEVMLEVPDPKVLALAVQTELRQLNCYLGALDGDWGNGSKAALAAYYDKAGGTQPETLEPTSALLQDLKARPEGNFCPASKKPPKPPKPPEPQNTVAQPPEPPKPPKPPKIDTGGLIGFN